MLASNKIMFINVFCWEYYSIVQSVYRYIRILKKEELKNSDRRPRNQKKKQTNIHHINIPLMFRFFLKKKNYYSSVVPTNNISMGYNYNYRLL